MTLATSGSCGTSSDDASAVLVTDSSTEVDMAATSCRSTSSARLRTAGTQARGRRPPSFGTLRRVREFSGGELTRAAPELFRRRSGSEPDIGAASATDTALSKSAAMPRGSDPLRSCSSCEALLFLRAEDGRLWSDVGDFFGGRFKRKLVAYKDMVN